MNLVPIHVLKRNLAYWAEKAAKGENVRITRFNKAYMTLGPARAPGVHWGKNVGKGKFRSVVRCASKGLFLKYLEEDRNDE